MPSSKTFKSLAIISRPEFLPANLASLIMGLTWTKHYQIIHHNRVSDKLSSDCSFATDTVENCASNYVGRRLFLGLRLFLSTVKAESKVLVGSCLSVSSSVLLAYTVCILHLCAHV